MNTRRRILLSLCTLFVVGVLLAGCGGSGSGAPQNPQDKIFYHSRMGGGYHIYSMNMDGTGVRQLTTTGVNEGASVTGDGSKVVFTSDRAGVSQVFIMNADGTGQTQLTNGPTPATGAAISGDGTKIVFTKAVDFVTPGEVYIMDADGSNPTVIPNTSGAGDPELNYDGSKVTFTAFDGVHNSVFVIDADGSNKMNIMTMPRSFGRSPKFSPDGSKIIYDADTIFTYQIVVYDIATATDTIVTDDTNENHQPCFSRDGSKIVFSRHVLSGDYIFSMNVDGTGETQLTTYGMDLSPVCPMMPVP